VRQHVLLPFATRLEPAAEAMRAAFTDETLSGIVAQLPDDWLLAAGGSFADVTSHRAAYVSWLRERRDAIAVFLEEALRARAQLV
jgi:hypothetical protein